jgi:hypothetical protein
LVAQYTPQPTLFSYALGNCRSRCWLQYLLLLLLLLQEQPDRAHKATLPTGVLQDPKGAKLETKHATKTTR